MKRLIVINDGRSHWEEIEDILSQVNARMETLSPAEGRSGLARAAPNLLILGEESFPIFADTSRELTKLVISEEISPGSIVRAREGRNVVKVGWPGSGKTLQELTRRLLYVPERRPLRTGLLILDSREGRSLQGETEDFSLTGIAFRTAGALEVNREVALSVGDSRSGKGISVEAQIVRSAPDSSGGGTFYGARFIRLSPEGRHALERFVWSIRRQLSRVPPESPPGPDARRTAEKEEGEENDQLHGGSGKGNRDHSALGAPPEG